MSDYKHKWRKDSSNYYVIAGQSVREFRSLQEAISFAGINKSTVVTRLSMPNDKEGE